MTKEKETNKETLEEVEEKLEKVVEEEKNYLEDLQRLQAEFQNFQNRTAKEKAEIVENANKNLILELVPALENLEKAIKHEPENSALQIIQANLIQILEKQGLKEINTKKDFNPEFHDAISTKEGKTENKILEVYTKGYTLNEKLLKPAIVKISKLGSTK